MLPIASTVTRTSTQIQTTTSCLSVMINAIIYREHVLQSAAINLDIVPVQKSHACTRMLDRVDRLMSLNTNTLYRKISPLTTKIVIREVDFVHQDVAVNPLHVRNLFRSVSMYIWIITQMTTITLKF